MEFIKQIFDIFTHLDRHLYEIIQDYGVWTYAVLFLIIALETGLVVVPFLPGDSLLFAAGVFAGAGMLDLWMLLLVLTLAAVLGDAANYGVGYHIGGRLLRKQNSRVFKKEYIERTQHFYEKYGGKTIVIARFVPIVRTFAPFLAGVGRMSYLRFALYNITGAVGWVTICVLGGFYFGTFKFVKNNFSLIILAVIIISMLPALMEIARHKFQKRQAGS